MKSFKREIIKIRSIFRVVDCIKSTYDMIKRKGTFKSLQ